MNLPIDLLVPEILISLEKHPNLILEASPGSGKTTRVPPALLRSAFRSPDQEIWVLEPRRLAAKYSAQRIATEMNSSVGAEVGYQFRFETVCGPKTRLRFITEGMFMRLLAKNPRLERVAAVILDEFHERHIHSDVALGYLRWLQSSHRPDLRIVLMSATLESEPLSKYLGNAPILRLKTQLHPVTLHYLPGPQAKQLDQTVREVALKALQHTAGDLLVFLPGMAEIRRCEQALSDLRQAKVYILHGELARDEQDQALALGGGRKIILSTNIAETSLTLPGVTAVIDSGLHRMASYSWWSGIPSLKTRPISRASAIQRAGRAGRTGPGACYRLFTQGDFETRAGFEKPEIMRTDLSQIFLDLKAMGVMVSEFPWFETPPSTALRAAEDLLYRLGATGKSGDLTETGRSMSRIAAHPRISRMLLEAQAMNVLEPASWFGAGLLEGRVDSGHALDRLESYTQDESLRKAQRILIQSLQGSTGPGAVKNSLPQGASELLTRSVLAGFSDRVAQKRKLGPGVARGKAHEIELVLSSGGSAILEETPSMAGEEFFILLDLQEQQNHDQRKSNLRVRSWLPMAEDWLLDVKPIGIEESEECTWDVQRKKVIKLSRLKYGDLVLSESASKSGDSKEVTRVLMKKGLGIDPESAAIADWISVLTPLTEAPDAREIESAFARAKIYMDYEKREPRDLWTHLSPLLGEKSSLAELRDVDWPSEVLQALVGDDVHRLREVLPTQLTLPSGRKAKIYYPLSQSPWVQSRLQDFFGMKKGPVLLKGRLPLLIHLLAPNQRPVQVTSDLEGFWKNHYPKLRPALSRRYPRHAWPENPGENGHE